MRAPLLVTLALLVPSAAEASGYINSGYINSGYINSGYINSGYINSGYINSGYINSGYINGATVGGFSLGKMSTAQGQPIDNVVMERDYLVGYAWVWEFDHFEANFQIVSAWHYRRVEKTDFLNATFEATVNDSNDTLAGHVLVKITALKTIAGDDGTTHYQHILKWQDATTGALTGVCGCENDNPTCTAPVPATLVQGGWNYTQGTIDGGKKISNDPNQITMACAAAAISKCSSDQATTSPLTPYYSGAASVPASTWVHKGSWIVYPKETITVKLTGVTGDPDLYVKWNGQASAASYTCRPYAGAGQSETCTLVVPSTAYSAYISIYGYSASSATLTVTASGASPRGMGYLPYATQHCWFNGVSFSCETSPQTEQQACTRMVTADYCGNGIAHTITGRPIEVYDYYNPQVNSLSANPTADVFESRWSANGAESLGTCRTSDMDFSPAAGDQCPNYGGYQHYVAHLDMLTNTFGQVIGCKEPGEWDTSMSTDTPGYLYNFNTGTFYPRQSRSFSFIR